MFMFVTRGHKPVYRTHTHLSTVNDFTTDGRDLCFVQLAEMLERHPEVKGWIGGSWLYDPALGKNYRARRTGSGSELRRAALDNFCRRDRPVLEGFVYVHVRNPGPQTGLPNPHAS